MDVIELTQRLVRIPSVSGSEADCVAVLRDLLPGAVVSGRNVYAVRGDGPRTLLLNSHTDTVPASEEWTADPHAAELRGARIVGLGANDAKGPLAALICAFLAAKLPGDARLVMAATCDEEVGGEGLDKLRPELPAIDAAIVGEPTHLEVCTGQRGLLRLRLVTRGKAAHASRPWQGDNAITKAARDIERIDQLPIGQPAHPLLGPVTLQVTMIQGGIRKNVIPPECRMELDGRTVPELDNETLHRMVKAAVHDSEVELVSDRFVPVETPTEAGIVQAALAAGGKTEPRGFGGVSDLLHVRDVPGIILGPGRSEQSHAANEWVEVDQLERGVKVYTETIERYFA